MTHDFSFILCSIRKIVNLRKIFIEVCCDSDKGILGVDRTTCPHHSNASYCGWYDDEDFKAEDFCCICGGGRTCEGTNFL